MNLFFKKFNQICEKYQVISSNIVIVNEKKVDSYCYGNLSWEENVPTPKNAIYRIASISKIIVAMAMMMLVEKGKANLNDDISQYLGFTIRNPNFINVPITIKMLMLHTSSITDGPEEGGLGYNGVNVIKQFIRLEELLIPGGTLYTPETFTDFEPGTHFQYSNFGSGILACIVEKISGEYFTDFIEKRLFIPLNIDASFRVENIKSKDIIASSYQIHNNDFVLALSKELALERMFPCYELGHNFRGPAGGLFISMPDLAKIMMILMNNGKYNNHHFLKEETVNLMYQVHWQKDSDKLYQAKGLQMIILKGFTNKPLRGHFGNAYGVRSFMLFSKEEKKGACFISSGGKYDMALSGMTFLQEDVLKLFIEFYQLKNQ